MIEFISGLEGPTFLTVTKSNRSSGPRPTSDELNILLLKSKLVVEHIDRCLNFFKLSNILQEHHFGLLGTKGLLLCCHPSSQGV